MVEERLVADLHASEANFVDGLGRERSGVFEDRR